MDIISCLETTVFGNGHNCKWKYCTLAITLIGNEWPFSATVGINQKTVCLTDDDVFDGLKAKDKEKKDNELKKLERKKLQEAKKEKLKKEKEEKKKQKELAKQAKKAGEGPEELERMLSALTLDEDESDDAVCPKCGLLYSAGEENLWVCCDKCFSWYDFKCTKLRSKRRLPDSYICDSCK